MLQVRRKVREREGDDKGDGGLGVLPTPGLHPSLLHSKWRTVISSAWERSAQSTGLGGRRAVATVRKAGGSVEGNGRRASVGALSAGVAEQAPNPVPKTFER